MKCIPQTCAGRPVAAASRPIGIDEVLDASSAPAPSASSSCRKSASLSSTSSLAASIASSASEASASSVEVEMRASTASGSAICPLAASFSSEAAMPARPRSSCS